LKDGDHDDDDDDDHSDEGMNNFTSNFVITWYTRQVRTVLLNFSATVSSPKQLELQGQPRQSASQTVPFTTP